MGTYPIVDSELKKAAGDEEKKDGEEAEVEKTKPAAKKVTEMGTYATQSALVPTSAASKKAEKVPVIRGFLLDGEFFIAAVLATTLTKVALRFAASETNISHQNLFVAK